MKNSCYSIERRLCLRLFLFLALYAIIGFAVLLLSNYVLEVFPSSVCTWISQRLDVLFALYLIIGFSGIFYFYWKKPWGYLNEVMNATEIVYEQNDHTIEIQFKREYRQDTYGDVTPQKIADALRIYQKYVQQYGTVEDMPLDVYTENVMAIRPLLDRLPEAFADPQTGIGADLMEIDPDMVEQNLYGQFASHLNDIMNLEQKEHPSAREFAIAKYAEVDKPYQLYSGLSRDAFDYIELYIFILSILCIAMVAPTFANEYQTGSDSIMRCTKNGRVKFSVIKILAAGVIFTVVFIVGMVIHLSIINLAFGAECLKTSFQMLFSIINLPNINLGQLQVILVLSGLLSLLASISCTLFLSAKCKDSLSALLISLAVMLLPTIVYTALGSSVWVSTILPSAGIGLQNNFLYQLYGFNFLHIGDMSFWTPYIILISAALEIPVFGFLAIRSYCKHRVA